MEVLRPEGGPDRRPAVFVVDDAAPFRGAVADLIDAAGLRLAGTAASAEEAMEVLTEGPDVDLVVMDVQLPGMDGIGACARLTAGRPGLVVLLVSTLDRRDLPSTSLTCGAAGFASKDRLGAETLWGHLGGAGTPGS